MRAMSWNILFGGHDGADGRRLEAQAEVIRSMNPDVLLIQEAKGFLDDGRARLFAFEAATGMRGFVAKATHTGQHTAIFVGPSVTPLAFSEDSAHFHHAAATLRASLPGLVEPVTFVSVHLCPNSPAARANEASYLFNLAAPDKSVLLAGDFNSVSPDDAEPIGLGDLPGHFRIRYAAADGLADRTTVGSLLRSGFVDLALRCKGSSVPTVPASGFTNTEFMPFRSDYFLATDVLAARVSGYQVLRDQRTDTASDHYPIVVDF